MLRQNNEHVRIIYMYYVCMKQGHPNSNMTESLDKRNNKLTFFPPEHKLKRRHLARSLTEGGSSDPSKTRTSTSSGMSAAPAAQRAEVIKSAWHEHDSVLRHFVHKRVKTKLCNRIYRRDGSPRGLPLEPNGALRIIIITKPIFRALFLGRQNWGSFSPNTS